MISEPRRLVGALSVAGVVALGLVACAASPQPAPSGTPAPSDTTASADPYAVVPEPGRTVEAAPPADAAGLRGMRVAIVVPDDETARTLLAAARAFADRSGAVAEVYPAGGEASLEDAFARAVAAAPDVVLGLGEGVVPVFAYETGQWLDQQFLVVGAQLAEPTANVTAVVWEGATSRGSDAPADGPLDPASATPQRAADAVAAGLGSVHAGVTGLVLMLGR